MNDNISVGDQVTWQHITHWVDQPVVQQYGLVLDVVRFSIGDLAHIKNGYGQYFYVHLSKLTKGAPQ